MPIYCAPPTILLKIASKRANGTVIDINGNRYRLFDKETRVIELNDRSGETGYVINVSDHGCTQDGIYTITVDVPNDRTNRRWQFVLINGISYGFEDAPYIFKSKGTIRFNEGLTVYSQDNEVIKNSDENSFNFAIHTDIEALQFIYNAKDEIINLSFVIPVLKWKFDKGLWNVERPSDIWHSDFPTVIYFKYPDDKIKISIDEQIEDDNDSEEQTVTCIKSISTGAFECDSTRFKSWFGREKLARSIFIDLSKNRTEFIRVITQSVVIAHILTGDFESGKLIGKFDIVGNANYYVDVMLHGEKTILADKLLVIEGNFEIESTLSSGVYKVSVFEDEEDDTGFGVSNYLPIGVFEHNLIKPYDLQGMSIAIKYIKKGKDSFFQMQTSCKYVVCNLQRKNENDKYNYKGKLLLETVYGNSPIVYDVNVQFYDLNKVQYVYLTYYDGYDFVEFLYDTNRRIIVKTEEQGLTRAVRYRRYESLYPEDYIYVVEFTNDISNKSELSAQVITRPVPIVTNIVKIQTVEHPIQTLVPPAVETLNDSEAAKLQEPNDILDTFISDIKLSMITLNCLKKANILTVRDITERGIKKLGGIHGFNKSMCKEMVDRLYSIGVSVK